MSGMNRSGERSLWCSVVLTALDDYNRDYCRALRNGGDTGAVMDSTRRYFASRDGRECCALAGMDIDPSVAATVIACSRSEFKHRMSADPKRYPRRDAA